MPIAAILAKKVLRDRDQQVADYLLAKLPKFTAPTNAAAWKRQIPRLQRELLARAFLWGVPDRIVQAKPRVVWGEVLRPDRSYRIRKLRYEAYPGYWVPALLYEPTNLRGRAPVMLNPNGHHSGGKATDYKQIRCANLARRGIIALNLEWIGMGELQGDHPHMNVAHLDLTGLAGLALFYLNLKKGLDVLLSHPRADRRRVGVTGLSGGGWQTIVISALDPRVTLSVPVAGYITLRAAIPQKTSIGHAEQVPVDFGAVMDYDTLTAMLAPRPALLILNHHDDCCFKTPWTRPGIYDAVRPTYEAMGAGDKFAFFDNFKPGPYSYDPGNPAELRKFLRRWGRHNYGPSNRAQLYQFLKRHFGLPAATPEQDIHRPDEVRTETELNVGLPPDQKTLLSIAADRAAVLCRRHPLPRTEAQRRALRKRLSAVMRRPVYHKVTARTVSASRSITLLALKTGPWTVPVTRFATPGTLPIVTLNDAGRTQAPPNHVAEPGPRYHVELLGTGEATPPTIELLNVIDFVGDRLLGIQVAQLLAAAKWIASREKSTRVRVTADGVAPTTVAMLACALEPGLFATCSVFFELTTFQHLMTRPIAYEAARPCFCAGLLEVADIPQIRALMTGVQHRSPWRCVIPETA